MYDLSIPFFNRYLKNMSAILARAEAHCEARKIKPEALLNFRLFPDMMPFTSQIRIACDFAKGAGARLSGTEVPSFTDDEQSFADLQARIEKTVTFLATLNPDNFKGAETRTISLKIGGKDMSFPAVTYLQGVVMPNFHFHLTTAYDILRHNGIELSKTDYVGAA